MTPENIDRLWAVFREHCISPDTDEDTIEQNRVAFYAGALAAVSEKMGGEIQRAMEDRVAQLKGARIDRTH